MIDVIVITSCLIVLGIGSYTDIRTREVPDWLSYGFIFFGLGFRLIYAIMFDNWFIFLYGITGFLIFFLLGLLLYYTGQWGGGDSKTLMGLGSVIGFEFIFGSFLVSLFINMLFVGAVYGLLASMLTALMNKKKFINETKKIMQHETFKQARKVVLTMSVLFIISAFFASDLPTRIVVLMLAGLGMLTLYLWTFVRAVEKAAMYKYVKPTELTEGDWIVDEVKVKGKQIVGPKDLGVSKEQIKTLISHYRKGHIKKILIKNGIPFVPSFLIAFIVTLFIGNMLLFVM